jgi:hypothetical protein
MHVGAMVAVLDYNYHLRRQYKIKSDGEIQLHKGYSARSRKEFVRGTKNAKMYPYIKVIIRLAEHFAAHPDTIPIKCRDCDFNPSQLAPTIRPIQSRSSVELFNEHKSRFQ